MRIGNSRPPIEEEQKEKDRVIERGEETLNFLLVPPFRQCGEPKKKLETGYVHNFWEVEEWNLGAWLAFFFICMNARPRLTFMVQVLGGWGWDMLSKDFFHGVDHS